MQYIRMVVIVGSRVAEFASHLSNERKVHLLCPSGQAVTHFCTGTINIHVLVSKQDLLAVLLR